MKTLYCLFFVALLANSSFAQNSILAGKIVDENGKPIAGAQIRVRNAHDKANARSNGDGLFYTRLLPSANYQLSVVAGGKNLGYKKLYLPPQDKKKVYYTLKVTGDKMLVTVDTQDPFMKTKLTSIEEDNDNIIDGLGMRPIQANDTGKKHFLIQNHKRR
jgi:hypothetical protein